MNESVALRRGAQADAEAVRALVEAAYTKRIPVIGRLPIPMQADYAQALRDHRFDLLLAGPDLAGLIETRAEADHLLVVNVAVHPAFQGRGFGSRLMGRADAVAAEAGLRAAAPLHQQEVHGEPAPLRRARLPGGAGGALRRTGPDPRRRRHRAHGEGPRGVTPRSLRSRHARLGSAGARRDLGDRAAAAATGASISATAKSSRSGAFS